MASPTSKLNSSSRALLRQYRKSLSTFRRSCSLLFFYLLEHRATRAAFAACLSRQSTPPLVEVEFQGRPLNLTRDEISVSEDFKWRVALSLYKDGEAREGRNWYVYWRRSTISLIIGPKLDSSLSRSSSWSLSSSKHRLDMSEYVWITVPDIFARDVRILLLSSPCVLETMEMPPMLSSVLGPKGISLNHLHLLGQRCRRITVAVLHVGSESLSSTRRTYVSISWLSFSTVRVLKTGLPPLRMTLTLSRQKSTVVEPSFEV